MREFLGYFLLKLYEIITVGKLSNDSSQEPLSTVACHSHLDDAK